ncbi:hypothetical protein B0H14DRAFT_2698161 [Mycena olivaceomarginata]|nr:hypothetical protein B0H14DRAFT_2698161 [Mycena olivaceomarginata]
MPFHPKRAAPRPGPQPTKCSAPRKENRGRRLARYTAICISATGVNPAYNEAKQDMRKRVPGSRKPESSDPSPPRGAAPRTRPRPLTKKRNPPQKICHPNARKGKREGGCAATTRGEQHAQSSNQYADAGEGGFKLPRFYQAPTKHPNVTQIAARNARLSKEPRPRPSDAVPSPSLPALQGSITSGSPLPSRLKQDAPAPAPKSSPPQPARLLRETRSPSPKLRNRGPTLPPNSRSRSLRSHARSPTPPISPPHSHRPSRSPENAAMRAERQRRLAPYRRRTRALGKAKLLCLRNRSQGRPPLLYARHDRTDGKWCIAGDAVARTVLFRISVSVSARRIAQCGLGLGACNARRLPFPHDRQQ